MAATLRLAVKRSAPARDAPVTKAFILREGKDGLRYVGLITSNAYADRDDEVLAELALKRWVDSVWKGGVYRGSNPLLFWHAGLPIGDVIWSDMRGPFLVEIAKERRHAFAKVIFDLVEAAKISWGVSHGFFDERSNTVGRWKVYRRIDKRETSILPLAVAANPFTLAKVKNVDFRKLWLRKNAPGAAALERELSRDVKSRRQQLDRAGVTRKSKKTATAKSAADSFSFLDPKRKAANSKARRRAEDEEIEKAIDPAALSESLAAFLDSIFSEAGVEAPGNLEERIAGLIESLDAGDEPVEVDAIAETLADASEELMAQEGAEAPDDLQEQIAAVIENEAALDDEAEPEVAAASLKRRKASQRKASAKRGAAPAKKQRAPRYDDEDEDDDDARTDLVEALLDDLSILSEVHEGVQQIPTLTKSVRRLSRQMKQLLEGGVVIASDDDETEVEEGEEDDDEEMRREIKRQNTKSRKERMFGDLYQTDDEA